MSIQDLTLDEVYDIELESPPLVGSRTHVFLESHERVGAAFRAANLGVEKLSQQLAKTVSETEIRQAQRLELLGQLAGGVAHDFNNLLAVIHGHASLILMQENLSKDLAESAEQISLVTERAAALTRQLLTFSRKQILQQQCFDLNETISNLTKMLKRILGESVALSINPAPDLPPVRVDLAMIEQMLLNLVVNARDAMPNGGKLIIETAKVAVDDTFRESNPEALTGDYVCINVADTGCGISPENLSHIFEPFFTTKEVGQGTGLGLSTVYGIVRQHGGWINVHSEVGRGSTFRIFLPAVIAGQRPGLAGTKDLNIAGGHETVLLVEDETSLRAITRNILERHGYRVLDAETGNNALEVWRRTGKRVDLLLTDMVMPGMSGKELAHKLRNECPSLKVIFTSAYSPKPDGRDISSLEGFELLQKPYSFHDLMKAVRDSLDESW